LLQAWRKIVVKMLPGVVQAKQLKRGVWVQDTLVDVRVMVEAWEAACAKLGADAAVDGGAVRCTYLEPALPSTGAPNTAPPVPRSVAEPRSLPAPEPKLQPAPEPRPLPAPEPRPQPAPSQRSSVLQSQQVPERPRALLVTLG
jgi:2-oxoglutarate dehydrogenase E2 component (dihydrolipoamide succinyltransferase)